MWRFGWWSKLAPAIVFGASVSCEAVVSLAHLDDGCPLLRGPTSVRIQTSVGTYCIDSTEVTNAQYQQFLSTISPATAATPVLGPGCDMQMDFRLSKVVAPGKDAFPVVYVNWCQAFAYCAWAGKRLCGRIGGGALAVGASEMDASQSQWFNACSGGGKKLVYPYGPAFDSGACAGGMAGASMVEVATHPRCVGGYPGIYDMSGNVWELADACDSNLADSACHAYGGAFDSNQNDLSCGLISRAWVRTSLGAGDIGFRCCTDL